MGRRERSYASARNGSELGAAADDDRAVARLTLLGVHSHAHTHSADDPGLRRIYPRYTTIHHVRVHMQTYSRPSRTVSLRNRERILFTFDQGRPWCSRSDTRILGKIRTYARSIVSGANLKAALAKRRKTTEDGADALSEDRKPCRRATICRATRTSVSP